MTIRGNAGRTTGAVLLLGAALLVGASCGGEDFSTNCAAQADSCADDEVCWPSSEGFACLEAPTSGGAIGAQCTNTIDRATCAHGLVCYPVDNGTSAPDLECSPRCDPPDTSPCPNPSSVCQRLTIGNVGEIHVCRP
jgi:hypothetical protein